jgi:acyl-CoA reductase-like NAD-dependent aldehyde dehydrogenase
MPATAAPVDALPSIDPATGATLGHHEKTPPAALPDLLARARAAQSTWAKQPIAARCERLKTLRRKILDSRSALDEAVVQDRKSV